MLKVRQRNGSNDPKNCELVRNLPPLMYVQGAALSVRLGGIHELGGPPYFSLIMKKTDVFENPNIYQG